MRPLAQLPRKPKRNVIKYHGSEGQRGGSRRWNRTGSGESGTLFVGELHTLLGGLVSEGKISSEGVVRMDCNGRILVSREREVSSRSCSLSGRSGFVRISLGGLKVGRWRWESLLRDCGGESKPGDATLTTRVLTVLAYERSR